MCLVQEGIPMIWRYVMKQRVLLVAAAIGFFLVAGSPGKGDEPAPPKEESEYAKVELKGQFEEGATVTVASGRFRLDLTGGPKEFQGEGWRKLLGETVIVTGTLRFLPPQKGQVLRVEVTSIRVVRN
jgi:hypothetical protein